MKTFFQRFCFLFFLFMACSTVFAADRYISDVLIVSLRDAPAKNSGIVGHLRSGDYITVLEELESGYIRVSTTSGLEGWIPKKYTALGKSKDSLINDLKKKIVALEELKKKHQVVSAEFEAKTVAYQGAIDTASTTEAKLQAQVVDLEKLVAEAQDKYITLKDQSQGVEAIYAERNQLMQENEALTADVKRLKIDNHELDQSKNIFWFLTGSGVLLIGWLIGRSGRKSRRNSLTL